MTTRKTGSTGLRGKGGLLAGATLVLVLAGAWVFWAPRRSDGHASPAAVAAVPVSVARVETADFPVYLDSLGTVEPYVTVTVRSRVDGEIVKVAFRQGQMVQEGDLLVQIDPRPYQAALDQGLSKKAQDEANLRNAKANLDRYRTLSAQDFASRQQLENQQSLVDQLVAQIAGDQGAIDNARTQLDYTTIRAPLSGKTGFRLIDRGNIVRASDQAGIVTIVKLQPISVVFTAPEEQVQRINDALAAREVPVVALSSDGRRELGRGHLALVNNEVDQAAGTIRMKATFANQDNKLWPGLSVKTRLLVETRKDVAVVPSAAVQRGPKGLYVFLVGVDRKVSAQPVAVDHESDGRSLVTEGLRAGQVVVVAGQYRLQPGSLVETDEPPAKTASGAEDPASGAEEPVR